jgi:hypothetical protein
MGRASRKNSTDVLCAAQRSKIEEILKQYLLTSNLPSLYHFASQYVARFSPAWIHFTEGACRPHLQRGSARR